jgi:hypothetical protein
LRRFLAALTCIVLSATSAAAEKPLACRFSNVPLKFQPPAQDFSSTLPIPDYVDMIVDCNRSTMPGASTPRPQAPGSAWLESEQRLYAKVLGKTKVDVLIAPVQVQGRGLDRIERALIAADLAYAVGSSRQLKVADPFLVGRALGEGVRRLDRQAVERLAQDVGARRVVLSYIGHDQNHTFTLTMQVIELSATGERVGKPWQRDWRAIPFTDERSPALVFHEMLPSVLRELPLGPAQAATAPKPVRLGTSTSLKGAPQNFVRDATISPAVTLNVLGALSSSGDERSRERLFERAFLVSLRNPKDDGRSRFLEAHALMYLHRRPAALSRIAGVKTPGSETLRALLNGDWPAVQTSLGRVTDPLERFLLQLASRDLHIAYRRQQGQIEISTSAFGDSAAAWAPLIDMRADDQDVWTVSSAVAVKTALDKVFPRTGLDMRSVAAASALRQGALPSQAAFDVSNARHIRQVAESLTPSASEWDLLWLLESHAEGRMAKSLHLMTRLQGLPDAAMKDVHEYQSYFDGHPTVAAGRAHAQVGLAEKSSEDERANLLAQSEQAAKLAAHWAQGQNHVAYAGLLAMGIPSPGSRFLLDGYGHDWPRRAFWPSWFIGAETNPDQVRAFALEALAFSRDDPAPLSNLRPGKGPGQFSTVAATLGSRFTGHRMRDSIDGALNEGPVQTDVIAFGRARLSKDPTNWDNYKSLGDMLILNEGKFKEAHEIYLSYPGFRDDQHTNAVALSNSVVDAGSKFYWSTQPELAIPLYRVAADLNTGSDASLAAAVRLDILAGNYVEAAEASLSRGNRYTNPWAYQDYLSFLHAFGMTKQAWEAFSQLKAVHTIPQVWTSALVGHRRAGMTERELREWIMRPEIRDSKFKTQHFAAFYAILWTATDRLPPRDLGDLVDKLEGTNKSRIDEDGITVMRPHPVTVTGFELVGASPFRAGKAPQLAPGTIVRSERAQFADAYATLRHGDYAGAVDRFIAMADRYPIEALPLGYFAYAAAKTGDKVQLERYVDGMRYPDGADYWLAKAFFAGVRKETDKAHAFMARALRSRSWNDYRPILVDYQYVEACEWLFKETQDERFIKMLLEWVRAHHKVLPADAWAYSVQFTYEKDPAERMRALAMTLYLDPASERIAKASAAEREAAKKWLSEHNPFTVPMLKQLLNQL